jgi:hypothetical protein
VHTLNRLVTAIARLTARLAASMPPAARARLARPFAATLPVTALSAAMLSAAMLSAGLVTGLAPAAAAPVSASRALAAQMPAAPSAGSGCYYKFVPPSSWIEVCQSGSGGGGPGGGGGGSLVCTVNKLTPAQIAALGLPPAPAGEQWDFINCPALQIPIGSVILASTTGGPPVTPQELLQIALGEITVPVLQPQTAPPLNRRALVGLPEYFWIAAADWKPVTITVAVGAVWATLTATPGRLTFNPGGGQTGASCQGPGVAYSGTGAAGACHYKYLVSSALQPGGAYQADVTVTWQVTWTGSGGVGGTINAGLQMPFPFPLRVAEGQALVTGP